VKHANDNVEDVGLCYYGTLCDAVTRLCRTAVESTSAETPTDVAATTPSSDTFTSLSSTGIAMSTLV